MSAHLSIADRPYVITFPSTRTSYPLTSEEVRKLHASYPLVSVSGNTLTLRADDGQAVEIRPATYGGGYAFSIGRRS